jgi:hypothetical protein
VEGELQVGGDGRLVDTSGEAFLQLVPDGLSRSGLVRRSRPLAAMTLLAKMRLLWTMLIPDWVVECQLCLCIPSA